MIIVTGGAGLIGSGIIWGLNQAGSDDIIVVDHLGTSEKWKNLRALKFTDYLEKDQFRKLVGTNALPGNITAIIHMGACSSTAEKDASYLIDNNYRYTQELALYAAAGNIRFIYASSCATYGDGSLGYHDDETALNKLRPMNIYGYSKHLFDLWAAGNGLLKKITGLKFSNVYGSNELHKGEMRSVVCRAYEQITASGKLQLFKSYRAEYADGEQKRDFLYVKDAVKMVLFLLEKKSATGIFNIGSGRAETWNSLAAAVFAALSLPPVIEYIDMPEALRDRYQYYTRAEMSRLKATGYQKKPDSLNEAIADYIKNYRLKDKFLGD